MKINKRYIEVLKHLGCGSDIYDSTLAQCVKKYKINSDGIVVAVLSDDTELDLLPILPTVKAVNKMTEFILKNAALSLGGIWQADDDGVINLKKINLIPGAVIPKAVGSSGLTPLKTPRQFNIDWNMVQSLQKQIRNYFNK